MHARHDIHRVGKPGIPHASLGRGRGYRLPRSRRWKKDPPMYAGAQDSAAEARILGVPRGAEEPTAMEPTVNTPTGHDAIPPIILLVDDDRDTLDMYSIFFESAGMWVATADSPGVALETIAE